jgi:hypothetical protein
MSDSVAVKRALSRLATGTDTDRVVIESAAAGIDDFERAAAFLDGVGLSQLALAVERQRRVGEAGYVASGEHALCVFRQYRSAATSPDESLRHIHSGRTTDIRSDVESPNR